MFGRFLDRLGILLFRGVLFFLRILPEPLFFGLAHGIEQVVSGVFSRRLRRYSLESLEIAFGKSLSLDAKNLIARRSFRNLFIGLAGFFYEYGRTDRVNKRFILEGQEHLDAALQQGRGVVVAIAHFGPFAWMLLKLVACGYRVNTVARPPRGNVFRWFFEEALSICGMQIILSVPARVCISASIQALRRNEIVVTPIDQNYGGPGRVFTDFFGRPAATAGGTAIFANSAQAPMLFAYALPVSGGRFRMIVSPVENLKEKSSPADVMASLTAALETVVRRSPEQWSWMHRRWKSEPKEGENGNG